MLLRQLPPPWLPLWCCCLPCAPLPLDGDVSAAGHGALGSALPCSLGRQLCRRSAVQAAAVCHCSPHCTERVALACKPGQQRAGASGCVRAGAWLNEGVGRPSARCPAPLEVNCIIAALLSNQNRVCRRPAAQPPQLRDTAPTCCAAGLGAQCVGHQFGNGGV